MDLVYGVGVGARRRGPMPQHVTRTHLRHTVKHAHAHSHSSTRVDSLFWSSSSPRGAPRDVITQGSTTYLANKLAGSVMALNSRELPEGSLKNMVHCSPGFPSNLRWGSIIKFTALALRASANA